MRLPDGEPAAGPWRVVSTADLGLPRIVAVDGRGGSGTSTVARRIADAVPGAAVVHTDDVAWHHWFFDWADLLAEHVVAPVRAGTAVAYRPPAWDARGRTGAITVPVGAPLVLVEGVGAGRRELSALADSLIWVQVDADLARARPRERADLTVAGAPALPHDPEPVVST